MRLSDEARAWLDDTARRIVARKPVRSEQRRGVEYEIMSHLHSAAESHASAAGRAEVSVVDLKTALMTAGGEDGLVEAFVTPLSQPFVAAGFWRRAVAYGIDVLAVVLAGVTFWALLTVFLASFRDVPYLEILQDPEAFWEAPLVGELGSLLQGVSVALFAVGILVVLALSPAYFAGFEHTRGRTPGKMVMGLRVVREDGGRPTLTEALLRNVTKLVPFPLFVDNSALLFLDVLGMLYRGERRRLSDRLLHTIVILEPEA